MDYNSYLDVVGKIFAVEKTELLLIKGVTCVALFVYDRLDKIGISFLNKNRLVHK